MKNKTFINFEFEGWAIYFLNEYLEEVGYNPTLYSGRSYRKTYSAPNADYQVVCWQTKRNVYCEVVR